MRSGLHVKYQLLLLYFNETLIFSEVFEKYSYIRFHENPSSGSQVVPCGGTDGEADMAKLIVTFRNFANAPTFSSISSASEEISCPTMWNLKSQVRL